MPVNFNNFTASAAIQETDQVVGFTNTYSGGERRWTFGTLRATLVSGAASTIATSNLPASKILASDTNGKVTASGISIASNGDITTLGSIQLNRGQLVRWGANSESTDDANITVTQEMTDGTTMRFRIGDNSDQFDSFTFERGNGTGGSGAELLKIRSNGFITAPLMPAFHVKSGQATVAGSDVGGYVEVFNRGGHLNLTNGRFTAPATGTYYFRWNQLAQSASIGEYRTALYVNNTEYGGLRFITNKTAAGWLSLIAEGHIYLTKDDYVTVRYESGPAALYTDDRYGSFSGHFIG